MLMVNKGNGINTDPVRYLEFSGVPKPRELARYCKFPTVTSDSVPSSIPLNKEGIFLTAVPINLIDGKYDLLFSDAKPWSNSKRVVGVEMTGKAKAVGHHAEYYGMTDRGLLKRQSAKAGAVAIKRRTTHYRGMITKTLFTMDANPYGVIVIQLADGWRDSLLESTSAPYLPRPICQNIREKTQGVLMDSDDVRARVVRDTSVLPTRQQVFNAARNVPRIKDMRGRKPYTDWPRLFVQLKRGGFVRYVDTSASPLCYMYTDAMAMRFMRESLVKQDVLMKRRATLLELYKDFGRDPSTANLNRLTRHISAKENSFVYPSLVVDSTFKIGGMLMTVLCYKSRNFLRNGFPIYLPVGLFAHASRDAATYKLIFDHFHSHILKTFGPAAHNFLIPGVITDGDKALKAAIATSTLFRGTQHMLCTIHLSECLDRYLRKSRVSEAEINDAQGAIFGYQSNPTPEVARVVTRSALDMACDERLGYVDNLKICEQAKQWVADNQENIESVSMESRLNGLHGLSTVTSNGVESINKQVKIWTQGSRDLPECADLLETRMLNIDRDLSHAVSGKGTEIACPRSTGMEPSRAAKIFGTASTCTDGLDMIPMFKDLEAVLGYKSLNQLRMKAASLRIFKWSDEAFSVYDDEEKVCYSVNIGRKQSCVCRASRSLCSHVLCVWGSLDRGQSQSVVEDYLNAKQVQTQQDQFAEFGYGSKNGKKRRRGAESTRRRTNTKIGKFVSNPYASASASEDGDSDASFLSMDADIAEDGGLIGQLSRAIDTSFPK